MANDCRIRNAKLEDAWPLANMHVTAWRETYADVMPTDFLEALDPKERAERRRAHLEREAAGNAKHHTLVIESPKGEIIGFAAGGVARTNDFGVDVDGELYALYLLKTWHNQGWGALMLRRLREWMRASGYRRWGLWVIEQNPTRRFYEQHGFALIPATKEADFGGRRVSEVAYAGKI